MWVCLPAAEQWCELSPVPAFVSGVELLLSLLCLSREEAKEMWEKREAEWAREQSARDRLMNEVLPPEGLDSSWSPLTNSALVILRSI